MAIYTFITDFQGGTYICQKSAPDLRKACTMWKEEIVSGDYIPKLKARVFSKAFDEYIDEFPPVAIDELRNVWLFHLSLGADQMDLHIVQTDPSIEMNVMEATNVSSIPYNTSL